METEGGGSGATSTCTFAIALRVSLDTIAKNSNFAVGR